MLPQNIRRKKFNADVIKTSNSKNEMLTYELWKFPSKHRTHSKLRTRPHVIDFIKTNYFFWSRFKLHKNRGRIRNYECFREFLRKQNRVHLIFSRNKSFEFEKSVVLNADAFEFFFSNASAYITSFNGLTIVTTFKRINRNNRI